MGRGDLLVVGIEHACHAWPWGIAVEEGVGSFPAVAVRGAYGAHFVVHEHDGSVRNIDHECVRCVPNVATSHISMMITPKNGERLGGLLLNHLVRHNLVKIVQHGIDKVVGVRFRKPCSTSHDGFVAELCRGPSYRRGVANCVLVSRFEGRICCLEVILGPFVNITSSFGHGQSVPMLIVVKKMRQLHTL